MLGLKGGKSGGIFSSYFAQVVHRTNIVCKLVFIYVKNTRDIYGKTILSLLLSLQSRVGEVYCVFRSINSRVCVLFYNLNNRWRVQPICSESI